MKISTKGRYGLRAVIDLVLNSNHEQVSLISIAERQDISKSYLEQVFSALRKSGIVNSVKGAQGGYVLSKEASQITVGMILRALEGELSVVGEEGGDATNQIENFIRNNIWNPIDEKINEFVDHITLEDIVNEYGKNAEHMMYYI